MAKFQQSFGESTEEFRQLAKVRDFVGEIVVHLRQPLCEKFLLEKKRKELKSHYTTIYNIYSECWSALSCDTSFF